MPIVLGAGDRGGAAIGIGTVGHADKRTVADRAGPPSY